MSLLDAFKRKYGDRDGQKLFNSQRRLASAVAAHKRTKNAIERRRQTKEQRR